MEKKLQKICLTYYNLVITQNLWQFFLSNLVNNVFGGFHRIKCKLGHDDKKCETCEIKYKYWDSFLETANFKDDLIEYICFCCSKNYQDKFHEKLKDRFFNAYKFSIDDNNKFIFIVVKRCLHL